MPRRLRPRIRIQNRTNWACGKGVCTGPWPKRARVGHMPSLAFTIIDHVSVKGWACHPKGCRAQGFSVTGEFESVPRLFGWHAQTTSTSHPYPEPHKLGMWQRCIAPRIGRSALASVTCPVGRLLLSVACQSLAGHATPKDAERKGFRLPGNSRAFLVCWGGMPRRLRHRIRIQNRQTWACGKGVRTGPGRSALSCCQQSFYRLATICRIADTVGLSSVLILSIAPIGLLRQYYSEDPNDAAPTALHSGRLWS